MDRESILLKITSLIGEVLELPSIKITEHSSAADFEEWDSMTHIQIIAAVEKHFKLRFALGELQELQNVGEMIDLILKKTK
jgi:acyl carrier protein